MVWMFTGTGTTTIPLNFEANIKYLKDYFANHTELHTKHAHFGQYISHTMMKFYWEPGTRYDISSDPFGPVEEHEWPIVYKTDLTKKRFGTLTSLLDMGGSGEHLVVDAELREIIERLDPGTHQFHPVRIATKHNEDFPGQYYSMLIGRFANSFSPENSDTEHFREEFDSVNKHQQYFSLSARHSPSSLAFSRAAFPAAHLWREKRLRMPNVIISHELRDAIKAAGLKTPTLYKATEVA
jgi:hypothetical protein